MALTHRTRRRLSILLLLVWLPLYVAAALYVVSLFDRPHLAVELAVYVALGMLWALPFRFVFRGVGREAPSEEARND